MKLIIFPDSWHKKSLAQLGAPVNIQNNVNDIKLSGDIKLLLDFAVTRFLHRRKFFNPENSFAVFYDQPYTLLPLSVF